MIAPETWPTLDEPQVESAQAAEERPPAPLKIADRCDRCGAQAFARARLVVEIEDETGPVDLLFCGHHFARHEDALRKVAAKVVDERHRIN